ncbi:MAG: 2-oxo acid dehydrogenase subunit E2 [Bacteroidales bacterium]|nr:2-oxo acid dehydrogenase subunit E2 [Bacteroidales bacterium]
MAVQTPKGLMVPVLRDVNNKNIPTLEKEIQFIADKARSNRISIDELKGGTFSITNGGVFGSLFSTPIINPPQSAILGMHTITERPVAISGEVKIRPMMYVALSYDHRIIDGKDSVGFLKTVKHLIENPSLIASGMVDLSMFLLGL